MSEVSWESEASETTAAGERFTATVIDIATRRPLESVETGSNGDNDIELLRGPYVARLRAAENILRTVRTQFRNDTESIARYAHQVEERREELAQFEAERGLSDGTVPGAELSASSSEVQAKAVDELPAPVEARSVRVLTVTALRSALGVSGADEDWQDRAFCGKASDPDEYFLEKQRGAAAIAKRLCGGCVVRAECLAYALENDEQFGIWGGMSERDRRKIRNRMA